MSSKALTYLGVVSDDDTALKCQRKPGGVTQRTLLCGRSLLPWCRSFPVAAVMNGHCVDGVFRSNPGRGSACFDELLAEALVIKLRRRQPFNEMCEAINYLALRGWTFA